MYPLLVDFQQVISGRIRTRLIVGQILVMGETLGISHNVFEKVEREKDRKER